MSRSRRMHWIAMTLVSALLAGTVAVAAPARSNSPQDWSGTADQYQQWLQGLSLLVTGRFSQGAEIIEHLAAAGLENPQVNRVETWLEAFEEMQAERAKRRTEDYAQYVGWVKEDMAAGKWRRAMAACARAFSNTEDEDAFRREPWVRELAEGSIQAAEDYERDGKWYKSAAIYLYLKEIFPGEASYREAFDRNQEHIRLELAYSDDSGWEDEVENIAPAMAAVAFRKIHTNYLRKPVFKDMVISALDHMLTLAGEKKLAEVFVKLGEPDKVEEFRDRIQSRLEQARQREALSLTDLIDTFERVLSINKEIQLLPDTVVVREFVHGALRPLDPFTDMLWPSDTDEFNKHTQGRFSGVGISIRKHRGEPIRVLTPLEDTPAYHAGIQPGDLITHINGKPAAPLNVDSAVKEITGPADTTVVLTVQRTTSDKEIKFDVKLKRAEITIYTIKGNRRQEDGRWDYMIDPESKIGYVRMTNFTDETPEEFKVAMRTLTEQGMRGMILDLRGNPGGTLKSAVDITNLFLAGDKAIVSTRDRKDEEMLMSTSEPEGVHYPDFPMILLINGSSASASEIVAGALQVHHRALIVGERSFGKGSVQQIIHVSPPSRQASIKLTTARYYLPDGRCLHHDEGAETWGVDPDVPVKLVPKEMFKVANMRMRNDILKGSQQEQLTEQDFEKVFSTQPANDKDGDEEQADAGDKEDEDEPPREDPNNWPEVDAQLEASLLLMRVRLETQQPWPDQPKEVAATPKERTGS